MKRGDAALEIVWSRRAQKRLTEIRAYVERDKPEAAEKLAIRIVALAETLKNHPYLGRAGTEPGIRELVVGGTPYIIFYRVQRKKIIISTIWHASQSRD